MAEILDIVIRQKGARTVARDIAKIGVSARSARDAIKALQLTLDRNSNSLKVATAQTQRASTSLKAFGATALTARRSLTAIGTGFALVGGAITAGLVIPLRGAITSAAEFQTAMNLTGVLANVDRTSEAFAQLEERAKKLGLTTQFSAVQAAEGMQFLAKAGLDANEVLGAIGPTTEVAAAAGLGLGRAADITTNILRGFRQSVDELPAAVDVLAAAFTNSNTDIEELARAFAKAGPVAVDLGQSFQDTAAVISALADAGIKASEAGTSLRRIFINLQKDSTKSNSVLRQLGISITQIGPDGVESMRPLIDIFRDISASSATTAQKIDLFGARALAASGILANASDTLQSFADKIADSVGRASEVGAARIKGFEGAVVFLNSALEALGIAIAQSGLLEFVQGAVEGLTKFIRVVAGLPKPILKFIGLAGLMATVVAVLALKIGLFTIAIGVLGGKEGFVSLIKGAGRALVSLKALGVFFLTNPIGIFITALGIGIALLFQFKDSVVTVGNSTFRVGDLIAAFASAAVRHLQKMAKGAGDLFNAFVRVFSGITVTLSGTLNFFRAFVNTGIALFLILSKSIVFAFTFIKRTIGAFLTNLVSLVGDIPNLIERAIRGDSIADVLKTPFLKTLDEMGAAVETFAKETAATFKTDFIGDVTKGILGNFEGVLEDAQKRFDDSFKRAPGQEKTAGKTLGEAAGGTVKPLKEFTDKQIADSAKALAKLQASLDKTTTAEKRFAEIQRVVARAVRTEVIATQEAADAIKGALFADLLDQIAGSGNEATKAMRDFNQTTTVLKKLAAETGADLGKIADAQRRVKLATEDVLLSLPEFTSGLETVDLLALSVRKGFEGFADGIGSEFELIKNAVEGTFDKALSAVEKFVTTGKFGFADFARSAIAEISKVVVKLIALQTVRAFEQRGDQGGGIGGFLGGLFGDRLGATQRQAAPELGLGGGGGGAGGGGFNIGGAIGIASSLLKIFGGGLAEGGSINRNQVGRAFLVGEAGPELFVPPTTGRIVPNDMLGGGAAQPVNVTIVNVDDARSIPEAMSTREGETAILNVITRNRGKLREILG